jgi:hypothetical protein
MLVASVKVRGVRGGAPELKWGLATNVRKPGLKHTGISIYIAIHYDKYIGSLACCAI